MTEKTPDKCQVPLSLNEPPIDYVFTTTNDQSAKITARLRKEGLHVIEYQGHPAFEERYAGDTRIALEIVFKERLPGWWNLRSALLREGICTAQSLRSAMRAEKISPEDSEANRPGTRKAPSDPPAVDKSA